MKGLLTKLQDSILYLTDYKDWKNGDRPRWKEYREMGLHSARSVSRQTLQK